MQSIYSNDWFARILIIEILVGMSLKNSFFP